MDFFTASKTDIGIQKETNQDALLIKTANTIKGRIGFFVVCDGMGGLDRGELASATAIQAMSDWFHHELPTMLDNSDEFVLDIITNIKSHINEVNERILAYGKERGIQLGTTLTAILIIESNYYTIQIGDSRAYLIQNELHQLTEDQSYVAREVARGTMSKEDAAIHPKRSVLLQCIGASKEIDVVITSGEVEANTTILLCTDGFYHEITEEEIIQSLQPNNLSDEQQMQSVIVELIERVKMRNEVDNISAVITKVI